MSFTMGRKALILNSLRADDVIDATALKIKGYCDFLQADCDLVVKEVASAGVAAAAEFTAVVPVGFVLGDTVGVEIKFNQGGRYISEYSSDFIKQGDTFIFQGRPATADAAGVATAIVAGWAAYKALFELGAAPAIEVTVGTVAGDILVTGQTDFINIEWVKIKDVPAAAKTSPAIESTLVPLDPATLMATEGNGQGKFLEESIRTANYTNMDPYANKPHGSDSVDIRGSYTLYEFTGGNGNGWEPHEHLGTAIADQNVTSGPQKFTLYANEADPALIAALDLAIV